MRIINAEELEPDTEWDEFDDGFTSFSRMQIDSATTVLAWHKYPNEIPTDEKQYLIVSCNYSGKIYYDVAYWSKDLRRVDEYFSDKHKHGFWKYSSNLGLYQPVVKYWCEIIEIEEKQEEE